MKYVFTVLFFAYSFLYGQTELDSLENLLNNHIEADTLRVNLLIEAGNKLFYTDLEKSFEYVNEADSLSRMLDYMYGKTESLILKGFYYDEKSEYSKALKYYCDALEEYIKSEDLPGQAACYNNIGILYHQQGNYQNALEYYYKTLKIYSAADDKAGLATGYINIGIIYHDYGDHSKAMEYYYEALELYEKTEDLSGKSACYNNIGIVYQDNKDYDKALEYYQKSLDINRKTGERSAIAISYLNIGYIHNYIDNFSASLQYLTESLQMSVEIGSKSLEAHCYSGLAELYYKYKNLRKAYEYGKKSCTIAYEIGEIQIIMESSKTLAESCAALELDKEAYEYDIIFKMMNDSIKNSENIKKSIRLEHEYRSSKEKELARLEQEKRHAMHAAKLKRQHLIRNSLIAVTTVILLAGLYLFYQYRNRKAANTRLLKASEEIKRQQTELKKINRNQSILLQELKDSNAEKDRLFSIMAKDIKNPLQSLLAESRQLHENINHLNKQSIKKIGSNLRIKTQDLFDLLENLLYWARMQMGKTSCQPRAINLFSLVRRWINLLQEHLGRKNISIHTDIEKSMLICADAVMAGSIFQNLLANAIKYTPRNGKIEISAFQKNGFVQITVRNSGMGIPEEQMNKLSNSEETLAAAKNGFKKESGLELILCREFVENHKGSLWIENAKDKGTAVYFTLPEIEKQET